MVCRTPMIPAILLWNELWSSVVPGVYHVPMRRVVELEPSIIHAAALASSL